MDWTSGFVIGIFTGGMISIVTCLLPPCLRWAYQSCVRSYLIVPDSIEPKFSVQFQLSSEEKRIRNELGHSSCLVCLEKIEENHIVVECMSCHKYIGHSLCISKWFERNKSCPLCRMG